MRSLEEVREVLRAYREDIRERYGVEIVGIFGSYARGENSPGSDVDILVDVKRPIGLKFLELWDYLEEILKVKVDLLTIGALRQKPKLLASIMEDLVYIGR